MALFGFIRISLPIYARMYVRYSYFVLLWTETDAQKWKNAQKM
jgi:hypothetical protein